MVFMNIMIADGYPDGFCSDNVECKDGNSVCTSGICVCNSGYRNIQGVCTEGNRHRINTFLLHIVTIIIVFVPFTLLI